MEKLFSMKLVSEAIKVGYPLPCGLSPAISRHKEGLPSQQDPLFMLRNFQGCVKEEQCLFDLFQVCYHPNGSEWLRKELCHRLWVKSLMQKWLTQKPPEIPTNHKGPVQSCGTESGNRRLISQPFKPCSLHQVSWNISSGLEWRLMGWGPQVQVITPLSMCWIPAGSHLPP